VVTPLSVTGLYSGRAKFRKLRSSSNSVKESIGKYPDLAISNVLAPTQAISGQFFDVTIEVENSGNADAQFARLDAYLSTDQEVGPRDYRLGEWLIPLVVEDGTRDTTVRVYVPSYFSGNYLLISRIDPQNAILEYPSELNNTISTSIEFTSPPPSDLSVREIRNSDEAFVAEIDSLSFIVKNQGNHPAIGPLRVISYWSEDTSKQAADQIFDILDENVFLTPSSEIEINMSTDVLGVTEGLYNSLIQVDARNNFVESDEENNIVSSENKTEVLVKVMPMIRWQEDTLVSGRFVVYKFYADPIYAGRTIELSLKGDSISGDNQMYVMFENMPTPARHDFSYDFPNGANQRVRIEGVQTGFYYLLVTGSNGAEKVTQQDIRIRAIPKSLDIYEIDPKVVDNTGFATIRITGTEFIDINYVQIVDQDSTQAPIYADTVVVLDRGEMWARFDLTGVELGMYDINILSKNEFFIQKEDMLEVIEGTGPDFQLDWSINPSAVTTFSRATPLLQVKVNVANLGTSDLEGEVLEFGSPLSTHKIYPRFENFLDGVFLNQYTIPVENNDGIPGVLAPGNERTYTLYIRSLQEFVYTLIR